MSLHRGSCHCGRIAYEFDGEVGEALDCDCSLCGRRGALMTFVPAASFRLLTPRENLGTYRFHKKVIDHHFCTVCGIAPFSEGKGPDGATMVAVNLRCVAGVDPRALTVRAFEGKHL